MRILTVGGRVHARVPGLGDRHLDRQPEFTSRAYLAWPGKPIENAYVESFHGRFREECLTVSWFGNLFDARRQIENWREFYNPRRRHSSLGYRTPEEFAALGAAAQSALGTVGIDYLRKTNRNRGTYNGADQEPVATSAWRSKCAVMT